MAEYSHPGVYIEELPGASAIAPVSTSNTAFVGRTEQGNANEPVLITSWNAFFQAFGGFSWGAQLPFAVYAFFAQGGSVCTVVSGAAAGETIASADLAPLTVSAATPGDWGNSLSLQICNDPTAQPSDPATPVFSLTILYRLPEAGATPTLDQRRAQDCAARNEIEPVTIDDVRYYPMEHYPGVTAADLAKDTGQGARIEQRINGSSLFVRISVAPGTSATRPGNGLWPLSGGTAGSAPLDLGAALAAFDAVDNISLLVAPDVAMIEDVGAQRASAAQILAYCENRPHRDLFAILDTPFGMTVPDAVAYKTGGAVGGTDAGAALHSSCGAIYYPWIEVFDPVATKCLLVPPSGAMAGTYAATDQAVGPWQSPAGVIHGALNIATGVATAVTDSDQDMLNPNGVNAIRLIANYGILSYGARTLTSDPDYIYVAVRRTLIFIENSLQSGLQWVALDPDSPALRGMVMRDVSAFLTGLWQQGALFGSTAAEAFWVQCDAANNPPEVREEGVLYVDVGVAPTYPAEFVIIRIQQATLSAG
ncbi:phage tail sheath family protein [Breoghania sp. L-A4]|nr:phage tail sheath family protein [Breoghania sp. L-A4]